MEHTSDERAAVRSDLSAIFVSLELSRSTWLVTSLSPGGGEKMSKHQVRSGDVTGLLARFSQLQAKCKARTGQSYRLIVIHEAGLDGFWIHRILQNDGIESHVVDPASIATSRRRRRVKTDGIDGEALVRALLAYKRGEPRVCAMLKAPTPEQEDRRQLSRERRSLVAERVEHVNRVKGLLFAQGVTDYEPVRRDRRQQLEGLRTGDGRPLPICLKQRLSRELDRLELLLEQIGTVEEQRDALLALQAEAPQYRPRPRSHRQRSCRRCGASGPSPPWCFGLKGYSDSSSTEGSSPPTPVWLRHPGRAEPSLGSRASRKPATPGFAQR
jgi:transposase